VPHAGAIPSGKRSEIQAPLSLGEAKARFNGSVIDFYLMAVAGRHAGTVKDERISSAKIDQDAA